MNNNQRKKDKDYSTDIYLEIRNKAVENNMCREDCGQDTYADIIKIEKKIKQKEVENNGK